MGFNLGDEFPNIVINTTAGRLQFHEWLGGSWAMLFSHPRDFTPVCTTELSRVVLLKDEFVKRGLKVIALSCDSVENHSLWAKDIQAYSNVSDDLPFPIIADPDRSIAKLLGMIDPDELDHQGMPVTCRAVFVIGPDRRLKLSILYPATTGRNFDEILRAIDSVQLTSKHKLATPADWKVGDKCMIVPSLSAEEAKKLYPNMQVMSMPSGKEYMRFTDDYIN